MGLYETESYLYNNKNAALGITILFIMLLVGLMFFIWLNDSPNSKSNMNLDYLLN